MSSETPVTFHYTTGVTLQNQKAFVFTVTATRTLNISVVYRGVRGEGREDVLGTGCVASRVLN
jgi:hypothetical protein